MVNVIMVTLFLVTLLVILGMLCFSSRDASPYQGDDGEWWEDDDE